MARAARTDPRLDLAVAAACVVAALVCMALPVSTRDPFAGALRGTFMAPLVALQERAELGRRTFTGHDAAARATDSTALRSLRLEGVEAENAQLRALLGLGAALRWGFVPAEALRPRDVGDERTLILSAGRLAGVEPLSAVVAPDGLVGMVDRADATMSNAILWLHQDFRVSGMSMDGSAYGMIQSHGGTGADRYFLEMRGVLLRNQLDTGTLVVTSGMGGVFPRGIPIGKVVSELKTAEQWGRTYLLKPTVALSELGTVMVLRPDRARAGVLGVWANAAGADSAARRVVSAIDSIARLTGDSNTVRQRRAIADSARAAGGAVRRPNP